MSGFRVILVNFFFFVSENIGFGMVLKKLLFGNKCVVNFDDFGVWVEEIKRVYEIDL